MQIVYFRFPSVALKRRLLKLSISFSIGDGNGKNLIGRMRKNKRAARAARTLEQFRTVREMTTCIWGVDESLSMQL